MCIDRMNGAMSQSMKQGDNSSCICIVQGEVPEGRKGYFELPVFNYFEVRCLPHFACNCSSLVAGQR